MLKSRRKNIPVLSLKSSDWKKRLRIQYPESSNRFSLTSGAFLYKRYSAISLNRCSSFNPERERGFKMAHGRPKTPLLRTDGERGFVFCSPGKSAVKDVKSGVLRLEIKRAFRLFDGLALDGMCINHGGSHIAMPQQLLNRTNIIIGLQ